MKRYIYAKTDINLDELPWTKDLEVTEYFDDFIRANIKNPDFFAWGRDVASSEDIIDLWRELRTQNHLKNIYEIPIDDAVEIIKNSIRTSTLDGWFRNADSGYKPSLVAQILSRPDVLNAGLNIAYHNYKFACKWGHNDKGEQVDPLPFNTWLYTPQVMYRGETGKNTVDSDAFMSYTTDPEIANKFANYIGGTVHRIKIRPIDTWGSYQTTGECEYLVPKKHYRQYYT